MQHMCHYPEDTEAFKCEVWGHPANKSSRDSNLSLAVSLALVFLLHHTVSRRRKTGSRGRVRDVCGLLWASRSFKSEQ